MFWKSLYSVLVYKLDWVLISVLLNNKSVESHQQIKIFKKKYWKFISKQKQSSFKKFPTYLPWKKYTKQAITIFISWLDLIERMYHTSISISLFTYFFSLHNYNNKGVLCRSQVTILISILDVLSIITASQSFIQHYLPAELNEKWEAQGVHLNHLSV